MLFLRIHSAEGRRSLTFYFEIKRRNILVERSQRSLKNEGEGDLNLEPECSDLFSFQERERERAKSIAESLAHSVQWAALAQRMTTKRVSGKGRRCSDIQSSSSWLDREGGGRVRASSHVGPQSKKQLS